MLTSFSIQAIGQSGRPDVPQILEEFKTKDLVNRVGGNDSPGRNVSGDVVQAAFFYDMIQEHGMDAFRANMYTPNMGRLDEQWTKTEHGKKWSAGWWSMVRRRMCSPSPAIRTRKPCCQRPPLPIRRPNATASASKANCPRPSTRRQAARSIRAAATSLTAAVPKHQCPSCNPASPSPAMPWPRAGSDAYAIIRACSSSSPL